jgi:hypothetical protein
MKLENENFCGQRRTPGRDMIAAHTRRRIYDASLAIAPATDSGGPFSADSYYDFGGDQSPDVSQSQDESLTPTATSALGNASSANPGAGVIGGGTPAAAPAATSPKTTLILIFAGLAAAGVAAIYLVHKKG